MDMKFKELFVKFFEKGSVFRTQVITFVTMVYNFFWSIGKILFGIFWHGYIYVLSGGYTLLIGFSKRIFVKHHNKEFNKETKSIIMGVLILISGCAFAVYTGTFLVWHQINTFGLIWSIFLAACSFVEMGIAIFNLSRVKKKNDIMLSALRCCNFVSAMFAIVITQVAILSATNQNDVSLFNACTGIVVGVAATFIGIYIIAKACKINELKKQLPNDSFDDYSTDKIMEILQNAQ